MQIQRDPSCMRFLVWRCVSDHPIDDPEDFCEQIGRGLMKAGFQDRSREIWLLIYADNAHHQVILVPRTGRIQIRVHYLTPVAERPLVAYTIARQLSDILGETAPTLEQIQQYTGTQCV